ncbi:MAG: tandem-95 repeat protein, partial [Gammaproteobacteria bacterium]|nr:tandem-95 repeat protein [Gammaproteobacteria bacterium]
NTIGSPETICEGDIPAGLTGSVPTITPVAPFNYQWQSSPAGASTWTDIATTQEYNPGALIVSTDFRRLIVIEDCPDEISNVITITVIPTATVNDPGDQLVCNGELTTAINFTGGADSYTWTNSNPGIGLAASGTGNIASFTAINSGTGPITATIEVIPVNSANQVDCDGNPLSFTITVNATPTITLGSNPIVCLGETSAELNYSATTNSPNRYSINFNTTAENQGFSDRSGVLSSSPMQFIVPSGAVAGTYNATLKVYNNTNNCESISYPITITISEIILSSTTINATTIDSNDGSTTITMNGGTSPYQITWDNNSGNSGSGSNVQSPYTITGMDIGTYTIIVTDVNGCEATEIITIINIENPPLAENDINTTMVNTPVSGQVLTNDSDPDGDALTVNSTPVSGPTNGTVTLNSNGTYTYSPNAGFTGNDSFEYEVCDPTGLCDIAIVTISVIPVFDRENRPPVAVDDNYSGKPDTPVTGNLISNDYDPDGDNISINTTPVTPPTVGTLTINSNGTFVYISETGFTGTVTFKYQICDDGTPSLCDVAVVTIEIRDITDETNTTVAVDDAYYSGKDESISGDVSANDYDPEGDNQVSFTLVNGTSNGTLTFNSNGTFNYTPAAGYFGNDQFIYEVCDNGNPVACDKATAYIVIEDMKNPPLAENDINTTFVNTPVNGQVLTNDVDPDGDPLTVNNTPVSGPSNGTVILNSNGTYTYTPAEGFTGNDSFDYEVCDDSGLCDIATVTISVITEYNGRNRPPVAVNDNYTGKIGTPVSGNLVSNDFDPDGDNIIINTPPVEPPSVGTLTIHPNGTFDYIPEAGFTGTVTFKYQICDDKIPSLCDVAEVTIEIRYIDESINTTVAVDDAYKTDIDIPILSNVSTNDYDPEGDSQVTTTLISGPTNGTLTLNVTGTFEYVPTTGFSGNDQFVYQVCDNGTPHACDKATVYILVEDINNPPLAENDINTTMVNMPISGQVLTNDFDPDGDPLTVNSTPISSPGNGTVTLNPNGTYSYTPNTGFTGNDSFDYEVCDDGGLCDIATVTISVIPEYDGGNRPPVAVDDNYTGRPNTPITGNLVSNDFDPDGDNISINTSPVTSPATGTLTINQNGTFEYIPVAGFIGTVTFSYQICDDGTPSLCDIAVVTLEIRGSDETTNTTVAVDDAYYSIKDASVSGDVSANDYDPEGDNQVSFTLISSPSNGTLTWNSNGTFEYVPNAGYAGNDQFIYEVCDNGNPVACDKATTYIVIADMNNPPLAENDINTSTINTPVSGQVLTNDVDPDGDPLTVNSTPINGPTNGTVTLNPNGTYTYTPIDGFTGNDSFDYEVCDDGGLCDIATVTISVIPKFTVANVPPVAVEDNYTGKIGTPVTGNLISNDFDPDGDNISINTTPVTPPGIGALTINPDGTFVYIPETGFVGTVTFTYQICDDGIPSLCDAAVVTLEIRGIEVTVNTTVAVDDSYFALKDVAISGDVSANDYDPEGDNQVSFTLVSGPSNGTLTWNSNGTFEYVPNAGYAGNDQFVYEVCDNGNPVACDRATAYFIIESGNNPPVAVNDTYTIVTGCGNIPSVTGNVMSNDYDVEGDSLFVSSFSVPGSGDLSFNADGSFTFTSDEGFLGIITFTYVICEVNNDESCDETEVTIMVKIDTDCDGIPDDIDVDDDDDGILDIHEGDGFVDTDLDGIPDSLDIDSDNDGITDNVEWQEEGGYIPPTGVDSNGDGWDDAYDPASGGIYYEQVDTDFNGFPDYIDLDSDGDGLGDLIEGHDIDFDSIPNVIPLGQDSDNDGLDDNFDTVNGWSTPGNPTGSNSPLPDFDEDGIRDWRDTDPISGDTQFISPNDTLDCELMVPEGFSPNDDMIHDYFEIYCFENYPNAKIEIYNRWGNLVYDKEDYGNVDRWGTTDAWWDGRSTHKWTVGSEKLPTATYFYILYLNDGSEPRTGSIFLNK